MLHQDETMVDTSIESPKQVICRLAKEAVHTDNRLEHKRKIDELRQFLRSGHSVDVDLYRKPATDILMEQDEETAALFLVNHFGADPAKIAYHYGLKHRIDKLQKLMDDFPTSYVKYEAMEGYVSNMDTANLNQTRTLFQLIDRGGNNEHSVCALYAARAATARGSLALVIDLSTRYMFDEGDALALYTEKGDVARVNMLLQKEPAWTSSAAEQYLWAGFRKEAKQLIDDNVDIDLDQLTFSAAMLEDDTLVEELISKGGSIDEAAYGYANSGNTDKVNKLFARGAHLGMAFAGFLYSCHHWLLDKYFPASPLADIIFRLVYSMEQKPSLAIRSLAFMQNNDHRQAIAQLFQFIPDIYKRSTDIHNLMKEFYLAYDSARFIQEDLNPRERKSFLYYLRERQMTFEQAYAIKFRPATKTWYKQASELSSHGYLNNNITSLVASYAFGLPYNDGETLREMTTPSKCKSTLFAASEEKQQLNKRKKENHKQVKRPRH